MPIAEALTMTFEDSAMPAHPSDAAMEWTCPFCALLCDDLPTPDGDRLQLSSTQCPRARARWAALGHGGTPEPWVDGESAGYEQAVAVAAELLAGMRQPLFGGCATDVSGARALFRLAARTGAICDHADGPGLAQGLRVLQDRGVTLTTLGEIRERADLVVCVGSPFVERYPRFFERLGRRSSEREAASLVFLHALVPAGLAGESIAGSGDLMADLQLLAALVDGRRPGRSDPTLAELARRLRAARYAVLVWEAGALPPQGALMIETLNRIAATLNRSTRAGTLGLGGNDGGASVNQTFAWLSGVPLRSRISRDGLRHEPLRYDASRLLAGGAVDGLLWVDAFCATRRPPTNSLPRVVLGVPALGELLRSQGDAAGTVFLPVATPGVNAPGHLFRTDGPVLLQLPAVRDDGLPEVAKVLGELAQRLEAIG